jgi:hypothetical protein
MFVIRSLSFFTLALVACGGACGGGAGGVGAEPPEDWAAAPDQYACATDEDCTLAAYHFEDEPCCNASFTSVQSGRFVTWRDRWQAAECTDVDCDAARASRQSTLSPQQPLPCYFEPRCNGGQCGGSCQ